MKLREVDPLLAAVLLGMLLVVGCFVRSCLEWIR